MAVIVVDTVPVPVRWMSVWPCCVLHLQYSIAETRLRGCVWALSCLQKVYVCVTVHICAGKATDPL